MMAAAALVLFAVYFLVGFVLRSLIQWKRTGDSGFRGVSGRVGSAEWWAGMLFAVALVTGALGPLTALAGLDPVRSLTGPFVRTTATVAACAGIIATFVTQLQMGTSWRIGVDSAETTDLVTTGPFARVRNPIFSAVALTALGLAMMVPNPVALIGAGLLLVALELQVRVVEEPYLQRIHGDAYAAYAARTDRFIPGVGKIRNDNHTRGGAN